MYKLCSTLFMSVLLAASSANAENIYDFHDYQRQDLNEYEEIAMNGRITQVDKRSFVLEYGSRNITVETNNITNNAEDLYIPGEYVKVKGRVDDAWQGQQVIKATRIIKYIKELD